MKTLQQAANMASIKEKPINIRRARAALGGWVGLYGRPWVVGCGLNK
jgi:hypothetical protein